MEPVSEQDAPELRNDGEPVDTQSPADAPPDSPGVDSSVVSRRAELERQLAEVKDEERKSRERSEADKLKVGGFARYNDKLVQVVEVGAFDGEDLGPDGQPSGRERFAHVVYLDPVMVDASSLTAL
jgi:hypothetical protein